MLEKTPDPFSPLDAEGHEVTGADLTRVALGELALLRSVRWLAHVPGVHGAVNAWFGR